MVAGLHARALGSLCLAVLAALAVVDELATWSWNHAHPQSAVAHAHAAPGALLLSALVTSAACAAVLARHRRQRGAGPRVALTGALQAGVAGGSALLVVDLLLQDDHGASGRPAWLLAALGACHLVVVPVVVMVWGLSRGLVGAATLDCQARPWLRAPLRARQEAPSGSGRGRAERGRAPPAGACRPRPARRPGCTLACGRPLRSSHHRAAVPVRSRLPSPPPL